MRFAVFVLAAVIITGCVSYGGTGTPVPLNDGKEFRMTIFHTGYSPSVLDVNKGDMVRILAVTGPGTAAHNHGITIDEYGINATVTTEDTNNPVKIEFIADHTGNFTIRCASCSQGIFGPAHPELTATLVVK